MTTVTAGQPLPVLLAHLARVGWGPVAGRTGERCRRVLHALCDILPHGSAEGVAALGRVAEVAGCSERTVTRAMADLEAHGLIVRRVGHVARGEKVPTWVRIAKRRIVELVGGNRHRPHKRQPVKLATKMRRLTASMLSLPLRPGGQGDTKTPLTTSGRGNGRRHQRGGSRTETTGPPRSHERCRVCGLTEARHTTKHLRLMDITRHDFDPPSRT